MYLSWNYSLLANISTGETGRGLVKPAEYDRELINSITDHEGSVKFLDQNSRYHNYFNKNKTCRQLIAGQIPSIPLGTLEPEPITPSPIPETLPSPPPPILLISQSDRLFLLS
jgi:hypothetical protein